MEIQFDRDVEAMAGLVWVVCAADDVGSPEEHNFIHNVVKEMDLFTDMSQSEFTTLLASTRTKLFSALPNNGLCLSQLAAEKVLDAANLVLSQELKKAAYEMATGLAKSDKLVGAEQVILDKMKATFQL